MELDQLRYFLQVAKRGNFTRAAEDLIISQPALIVRENATDVLLKSCTQGEIDLAIVALPVPAKYLDVEELFEEELFLALPLDHPLADKSRIRLSDVEPFPCVLLDEAHCLSDNIISFCRQLLRSSWKAITCCRWRREFCSIG